ncbi:MAG TPA: hypothetical protein PLM07_09545 [Candidatus Rifleibacterium sp.]|nr:hypothetical protein [Candidatus Rifleibacterium sp.]HPT46132.1 hypothetical protein [Candidatus Rifleibacterium sp.]
MKKLLVILLGFFFVMPAFAGTINAVSNEVWLDHLSQMQSLRQQILSLVTKSAPSAEDRQNLEALNLTFAEKQADWQNYLETVAQGKQSEVSISEEPAKAPTCQKADKKPWSRYKKHSKRHHSHNSNKPACCGKNADKCKEAMQSKCAEAGKNKACCGKGTDKCKEAMKSKCGEAGKDKEGCGKMADKCKKAMQSKCAEAIKNKECCGKGTDKCKEVMKGKLAEVCKEMGCCGKGTDKCFKIMQSKCKEAGKDKACGGKGAGKCKKANKSKCADNCKDKADKADKAKCGSDKKSCGGCK